MQPETSEGPICDPHGGAGRKKPDHHFAVEGEMEVAVQAAAVKEFLSSEPHTRLVIGGSPPWVPKNCLCC